jgi:hypothetical protein
VKASATSTDDEQLVAIDGGKAVIDVKLGNFLAVKLTVGDLPYFGEEAVIVIDLDVGGSGLESLHI